MFRKKPEPSPYPMRPMIAFLWGVIAGVISAGAAALLLLAVTDYL